MLADFNEFMKVLYIFFKSSEFVVACLGSLPVCIQIFFGYQERGSVGSL